MKPTKSSILLATSSNQDVQSGAGIYSFAGLRPVPLKNVTSIQQIKYRAEVKQVRTIGTQATVTIAAGVNYTVEIYDPNRSYEGAQESTKRYTVKALPTLTDMGATAAIQREYIYSALVISINNDGSNKSIAASLTGGVGITVTDDGGYYPVKSQTMTNILGANIVRPITNADGSGFAATNVVTTTAAVTSFGDGTILATMKPVTDKVFGNLISGTLDAAPVTSAGAAATAGQKYDAFVVNFLQKSPVPTAADYICYVEAEQAIYVDNGTGSATTNLAGFLTFENVMRRVITTLYSNDYNAIYSFFNGPMLFQGAAGAVPTTTGENKIADEKFQWVYNQIGTNTITVPTPNAAGLLLDQDVTATEGAEYTPSLLTNNKQTFVVGKARFSIVAKMLVSAHANLQLVVGFRTKAAHQAAFTSYTNLAAVGTTGALAYTHGALGGAATVSTSTAVAPVDAAYEDLEVIVAVNGTVTCKYKNVSYPVYSVGTTALVLAAGTELIPTIRATNLNSVAPVAVLNHFIAVAQGAGEKPWLG